MNTLLRGSLLAAGLLALTACTGAPIGGAEQASLDRYHPDFGREIVAAGPIPTAIEGNPSGLAKPAFDTVTLRRLALEGGYGPHRFALSPSPPPRHNWRVVLLFNPTDRTISDQALCRGEGGSYSQPQPEMFLKGALCNRGEAYASAAVRGPVPANFDSEAYSQFLAQLMFNMMPLHDPRAQSITCGRPVC